MTPVVYNNHTNVDSHANRDGCHKKHSTHHVEHKLPMQTTTKNKSIQGLVLFQDSCYPLNKSPSQWTTSVHALS
jgi:hypothetical protein